MDIKFLKLKFGRSVVSRYAPSLYLQVVDMYRDLELGPIPMKEDGRQGLESQKWRRFRLAFVRVGMPPLPNQ